MIPGDVLLDAFINANILFLIGYVLWLVVKTGMARLGLRHAYGTQLSLLNAVFVAIICAPLVVLTFQALQGYGVARSVNVNLSDMVVAHYLNGGFEMKASEFETLVLMRDSFVLNVLNADGLLAKTAIALFVASIVYGSVQLVLSFSCLRRIITRSYPWRRFGRIRIRLSDRTLVPFSTRGFRNYYVVIPSHMLGDAKELKVALAHEFQHIRQGDLEWEIALELLKPLFIFNPAFRAWKHQVEQLRELHCDYEVLSRGRVDVRAYCETLMSICQKTLRKDREFVLAVPKVTLVTADRSSLFGRKRGALENRILSALDERRVRNQRFLFAALAVPLLAIVTLTTLAIQSPGDWSQDRLMLSTVVNLDRLDEINRLSTFGRVRN